MSDLAADTQDPQEILSELVRKSRALTALIIGRDGTRLMQAGNTSSLDLAALGARVAALCAAGREVSRALGEERLSVLMQQGEERHLHLCLVNDSWLLIVIFEDEQRVGLVRHEVRRAAEKLSPFLPARASEDAAAASQRIPYAPLFQETGASILDRIFET